MSRPSLYFKFLLGYLVFGLLGFLIISTFASKMTYEHLLAQQADLLYDEASQMALDCSAVYRGRNADLATVADQLSIISPSLQSEFWVVDREAA